MFPVKSTVGERELTTRVAHATRGSTASRRWYIALRISHVISSHVHLDSASTRGFPRWTLSSEMRHPRASAKLRVPRNIFSHLTTRKTDHPTPIRPFIRPSLSKVIKADICEFGTYPAVAVPIIPFGSEKNAEREVSTAAGLCSA